MEHVVVYLKKQIIYSSISVILIKFRVCVQ